MTFNFNAQFAQGRKGEERAFAQLRAEGYTVEPTAAGQAQSYGIDAFITLGEDSYSLEVKTDFVGARTGNMFLETSVVSEGSTKPGWVYKTCAQFVLYCVVFEDESVVPWWFPAMRLKLLVAAIESDERLPVHALWIDRVDNGSYYGQGWAVNIRDAFDWVVNEKA